MKIYLESPLSDELVKAIKNELTKYGASLCGPIRREAGILHIIFNFNEALPTAIANIRLPTLLGWQIFDSAGNHLRGMRRFENNVDILDDVEEMLE